MASEPNRKPRTCMGMVVRVVDSLPEGTLMFVKDGALLGAIRPRKPKPTAGATNGQ